jgi:competence protein ComEC
MIAIMFLAVLLDRPAIALRNVAVSALVILAVLPESLLDIGFQMSYAAVTALVASYEAIRDRRIAPEEARMPSRVLTGLLFFGGIVLTTLIASVAVAPFGAYYFHASQQYAIIANLIAIPVCNIIVMPAALATLVLMPVGLEAAGLWVMGIGIDMMSWCATRVAGLPGAVARLPAMPQSAFLLMALGGIWLCIWRTRWRLLGLGLAATGLALSPALSRPDILVGHEGAILAVRMPDGRLQAVSGKGGDYELGRWLENDGDPRSAREVATSSKAIRCDQGGCTVPVKGTLVALTRHPSALADDCSRAGLLVLTLPRPQSCQPPGPAIDLFDLRDKGTHAVYLDAGGPRIVSVADERGDRPWTRQRRRPNIQTSPASASPPAAGSRLGMFAPPYELNGENLRQRPEVEDDDGP